MGESAVTTGPVRLAHIIQNLNYGGMERVLHSLALQLPRYGFEMHVIVLQYLGRFAEGLEASATLHQVPPMSRLSMLYPGPLVEVLRRIRPQIVHAHTGVWIKSSRAARLAGVPLVVYTDHGRTDPVPFGDRLIDNCASRLTDAIVAVSEPLSRLLARQVVHDPGRLRVITNGVDLEHLRQAGDRVALRHALGLDPDTMVIGSIGRLEPVKNYELALRAFARLPQDANGPVLVLAGDGSSAAALRDLASALGIAPRVRFLGWRNDADRLYGAFDLFTLTSRSEGTSISLLEAMASGVCPVVTDVGGNRAVMGPELSDFLVPDNDEAGLTAAWARCLGDPALRARAAACAQNRVRAAFSLEHMVAQHVELYRELLRRKGLEPEPHRAATG